MTNEQAISILKENFDACDDTKCQYDCRKCHEKAIKVAIKAIKKQDEYNWHNTKKNPEDLPEVSLVFRNPDQYRSNQNVLIVTKYSSLELGQLVKSEGEDYCGYNTWWVTGDSMLTPDNVYAWKYVEPFDKVD